jgi:dTMP kinase
VARRGRFIVFEGGEGSGKSTHAARLAQRRDALLTREPGGTALGERLRAILLDGESGALDARAELLLMLAARAEHCAERIVPTLESGRDVVCDRFAGSTLAYQGYGRGLPLAEVRAGCALAAAGLEPDLTILLDVPLAVAARRRERPADLIESAGKDFHERVHAGFATLAGEDPRWVVVDADDVFEVVAARVERAVAEALAAHLEAPEGAR